MDFNIAYQRYADILGLFLAGCSGFLGTLSYTMLPWVLEESGDDVRSEDVLLCFLLVRVTICVFHMIQGRIHPYGGALANIPMLFLMAAPEAGSMLLVFFSMHFISFGDFSVVLLTRIVFTGVLGYFILGEKCRRSDFVCGIVSCVGVIILSKPDIFHQDVHMPISKAGLSTNYSALESSDALVLDESRLAEGIAYGLIYSFLTAMYYVGSKVTGNTSDVVLTVLYPDLLTLLALSMHLAISGKRLFLYIPISAFVWLAWSSFCYYAAGMFISESFQLADMAPLMLIRNLDVVYAFIMQFFLVGIVPTWTSIVGGLVVFLSCSCLVLNRIIPT